MDPDEDGSGRGEHPSPLTVPAGCPRFVIEEPAPASAGPQTGPRVTPAGWKEVERRGSHADLDAERLLAGSMANCVERGFIKEGRSRSGEIQGAAHVNGWPRAARKNRRCRKASEWAETPHVQVVRAIAPLTMGAATDIAVTADEATQAGLTGV